jgi:hypothetical protein
VYKEMPVIPVNMVVVMKRIIGKNGEPRRRRRGTWGRTRVTRLGEISRDCLHTLGRFSKITEVAKNFGLLFPKY